jgi:hypothetical protein
MLSELGGGDFLLRDLQRPEPGRIRRMLSQLIQFRKQGKIALEIKRKCDEEHVRISYWLEISIALDYLDYNNEYFECRAELIGKCWN